MLCLQPLGGNSNGGDTQEQPATIKARRKHYSMPTKRNVLTAAEGMSIRAAAKKFGVPRRTLSDWIDEKEHIFAFTGSEKTLAQTPGRSESIPFAPELLMYMQKQRQAGQALTTARMVQFIRENYLDWLTDYTASKRDQGTAYDSLMRLLRRFARRHGFVQRTPHGSSANCHATNQDGS